MTTASLKVIKPNCAIHGILPSGVVTVVSVQWFGSDAIELTYKDAIGRVGNEAPEVDRAAVRQTYFAQVRIDRGPRGVSQANGDVAEQRRREHANLAA
jgi:hypothetical protein